MRKLKNTLKLKNTHQQRHIGSGGVVEKPPRIKARISSLFNPIKRPHSA